MVWYWVDVQHRLSLCELIQLRLSTSSNSRNSIEIPVRCSTCGTTDKILCGTPSCSISFKFTVSATRFLKCRH